MPDFTLVIQPPQVLRLTVIPPPSITSTIAGQQGPAGPAGSTKTPYPAAVSVSGHAAMLADAAGLAAPADATVPAHLGAVVGVSLNAALAGATVIVQGSGLIEHSGWTWTPDLPVFLGAAGALVQVPAAGAVFLQVLGWARSPTRLLVSPQPPVSF